MKKTKRAAALLLLILLALTGCQGSDPVVEEEPTALPTPVATPPRFDPTLEPTVTPRTFEGTVEEPAAGATPLLIYPIDLPAIQFTYAEMSAPQINVTFELPVGWANVSPETDQNRVTYQEPVTTMQVGVHVQSIVQISMQQKGSVQTLKNAEDELNLQIDQLKSEFPGIRVTGMANSRLLGEMGRYISYWVEFPYDANDPNRTQAMRGRLHVTPVDRKLYVIRTMHPADFNGGYDEVYKKVRESFKEM